MSMSFEDFSLSPALYDAVQQLGFETPTPIQEVAIPALLNGADVIGGARTGSGKTAAFGLPLLHHLDPDVRAVQALVLTPTRELAIQVADALESYAGGLRTRIATIYGGASYERQLDQLRQGATVVVGTPGRVLDLASSHRLKLDQVSMAVLDEADEMLRMGFIEEVTSILDFTPSSRQTALFSATMPDAIRDVAANYLRDPVALQVEEAALTVDHIHQRWVSVPHRHKLDALTRLLEAEVEGTTLVFARTRASCAEVADSLAKRGFAVDALHGDLNQSARERVLARLRSGRLTLLVATDIAARGIDIDHITHVINYDFPLDAETYVHRIGRTGRAGREGEAILMVTPREQRRLRFLQRDVGVKFSPAAVPTDAEILDAQKARLARNLAAIAEASDLSTERAWIAENVGATFTLEDLAAAALHAYTQAVDIALDRDVEHAQPKWLAPAPSTSDSNEEEVQAFLSVGRQHNVRPADIVGALTAETELNGSDIGRISVMARKSFVGLPKSIAERLFEHHGTIEVRGIEAKLRPARAPSTQPSDTATELEVFLPIGETQHVRPKDVLEALVAAGVAKDAVGKIAVRGTATFVRMSADAARRFTASEPTLHLRGNDVPATLARPREPRTDFGRPGGKMHHHKPKHQRRFKSKR